MRFMPSTEQAAYLQRLGVPGFGGGRPATLARPMPPAKAAAKAAAKPARPSLVSGSASSSRRSVSPCASRPPAGISDWLSDFLARIF